ncbi:MAG TPA: hypothetical protein VKG45_00595 [Actinomycetes bacterium]|nr:hypothetical protein [Actinomycetes bacterium]
MEPVSAGVPSGYARTPAVREERRPARREERPPVRRREGSPEADRGGPRRPPRLKAPTLDYLLDLKREAQTLYQGQDEQIRVMRQVRELLDPVPVDEDIRLVDVEVRVPILTDNVQRTVAIMGVNPAELQIKPSREDDDAQQNSTKRERATKGILEMAGRNDGGPSTYLMAIDSCVADGGAWTKLLPRWDDWDEVYAVSRDDYEDDPLPEAKDGESSDDYAKRLGRSKTKDQKYQTARAEAKKRGGVPFRWIQVDVATLYPFFGEGRVREVLEITKRPKSQCFRQYRLKTGRDGKILRSGQADKSRESKLGVVPEELGPRMSEDEIEKIQPSETVEFLEFHDDVWCFPGGTRVASDSHVTAGFKRRYEGDLAQIRTAGGHELAGTPNHPVLTARGWVPLGQLKVGDRVVRRARREDALEGPPQPDEEHVELPIEQVFELLAVRGTQERRPGAAPQFHGDGQKTEVHVVRTDRLLLDDLQPALAQPGRHLGLAAAAALGAVLAHRGPQQPLLGRDDAAPGGGVGGRHEAGAPVRSEPLVAYLGRLGARAHHPAFPEPAPDRVVAAAEGPGDLGGRLAQFQVTTDEVVLVERRQFSGHVHNLETESHYYTANGIVVHNCCLAVVDADTKGEPTGQVVDVWEHKNGRHPYFFAPGLWMNHWRHRKVGWGVSESMRWLVRYLSFLLTVHANIAARDAFSPLQEVLPDQAAPLLGENDRPRTGSPEPEKWQLGRIYRSTRPGSELRPINFSRMAEELKEQVKIVMDLIEQLLTPRVANQIGGNMEGAGFAIAQVLAEGRIRHDPIAQSIERMLDEVTEFLWHLIRTRVKEEVWVGTEAGETAPYESLGPKDLEEAVRIKWTVNAETPSAELLRARYWGERLANHTASLDQAIEGMGDNPDEVRFGLLMDRLRAHPAYQAWQIQMIFAEAQRGDVLTKFEESQLAGMGATGAVPGPGGGPPGMPPGPPGSVPGMPPFVPDTGALALAPGGAGAGTVPGPFPPVGGPGPLPGPMGTGPGIGPGATSPNGAAQAQLQSLGSAGA